MDEDEIKRSSGSPKVLKSIFALIVITSTLSILYTKFRIKEKTIFFPKSTGLTKILKLILLFMIPAFTLFLFYPKWTMKQTINYLSSKTVYQMISSQEKKILLYTPFFSNDYFGFGNSPFKKCPVSNCYTTKDPNHLPSIKDFDAIIFHSRDMTNDIPKVRDSSQRYIFFNMESPFNTGQMYYMYDPGFFNWTMTYRLDSDIIISYGTVKRIIDHKEVKPININSRHFKSKKNESIWIVSNCMSYSGRQNLVQLLQSYFPVTIIGSCGKKLQSEVNQKISKVSLLKPYKFYLAFENSYCTNYATEKFFESLRSDAIPVVLGKGPYTKIAPHHSYINVNSFSSVKALADKLHFLSKNETEWLSYMKWKTEYVVEDKISFDESFCDICKKLNDPSAPIKLYESIQAWWNGPNNKSACDSSGAYQYWET